MTSKIDIPELLQKREPFGTSMVELVTSVGGVDKVFPDGDYSNLEVEVKLNGVEVPGEILREIFFRHAKHFAQVAMAEKIREIFEPVETQTEQLKDVVKDAFEQIIDQTGLDPDDYDDRWY